ncbi:hypothetical protein [Sphingomonas sp. R86520]|uniref:hypothetical protein n=1 Tax=Sphingomonas sp. R86520 TaxID=3093859 RepID=UPI0036D3AF81
MLLRFASGMVMPIQVCWTAAQAEGWAVGLWGTVGRILSTSPIFPSSKDCKLFGGRLDGNGEAALHTGHLKPIELGKNLMRDPAVKIDADHPVPPAYPMALSMNAMVQAIRGHGSAKPDFKQAWQVERMQEAIRRSSAERRWVGLAEIT